MGFDANQWLGDVEHVVAERVGRETFQFVSNIGMYGVAYRMAARRLGIRAGGASRR